MTLEILDLAIPLRMLAEFRHGEALDGNLTEKKSSLSLQLNNCRIVAATATEQMNVITDPDLHADVCLMRAAAMEAILSAEAAMRADTLENFNQAYRGFQPQYGNLIARVKSFLWDAGPFIRQHLWPLVEKVM